MQFLPTIFWRLVLPIILGFMNVIARILGSLRYSPGESWFLPIPRTYLPRETVDYSPFHDPAGVKFWDTFQWAKEAEEFEANLKEADEVEKERRRRSTWIER